MHDRVGHLEEEYDCILQDFGTFKDAYPPAVENMVKINFDNLTKRIDELEEVNKHNQNMISRIGVLGESLHLLSEENNTLRKKPHSCPRCSDNSKMNNSKDCTACEGRGIVWG